MQNAPPQQQMCRAAESASMMAKQKKTIEMVVL